MIQFYTVGDGSVRTLAEEYGQHHAAAAARAGRREGAAPDEGRYAHFFLDVPADRSGARPHQALINFQDNKKADGGRRRTKKREKANAPNAGGEGRDIFKIQLAVLPPGMEEVLPPMLLYNAKRTAKTFLHPSPSSSSQEHAEEDDGGYVKIRQLITDSGTTGALGATGGQKVSPTRASGAVAARARLSAQWPRCYPFFLARRTSTAS